MKPNLGCIQEIDETEKFNTNAEEWSFYEDEDYSSEETYRAA